ncbi:hypothetical protein Fot_42036 [Forsythia ovata]|uniref:Uncharacterized protein n=1 Tax=Forsythia ovata TaxID=205694 RepID=A0ABD1RL14_9LAMI
MRAICSCGHCLISARGSEVTVDTSSALLLEEPPLSSENVQQLDKGNRVIKNEEEKAVPERVIEDEDDVEDSRKAKRSWVTPHRKTEKLLPLLEVQCELPFLIPPTETNISILGLVRIN